MPVLFYIQMVLYAMIAAVMTASSKNLVHILQLEGYRNKNFFHWLTKNFFRIYGFPVVVFLVFLIVRIVINLVLPADGLWPDLIGVILTALYGLMAVVYLKKERIGHAKKPLVFTGRVKRLFIFLSLIYLAVAAGFFVLDFMVISAPWNGLLVFVFLLMIGDGVFFANLCAMPFETLIKKWYFNDAKKKLEKRDDLIRIGVTGSFGKTSCKYILGTILSENYDVLVPPASYNTPMGLTRVIREQMKKNHEVFIAEMGARHMGDIKELCGLIRPNIGVITSVGPQHLETFGSIENVAKTKCELFDCLPKTGYAFISADNDICLSLYDKTETEKYLFGMESDREIFSRAVNIKTGPFGSRFDLIVDGETIPCETKLLGRHNIVNIAGCAAVAKKLGLTGRQIRMGIRMIEPVEHRLQILPQTGGVTVIDDAFNANPSGVRAAMEVLSGFEGRKIVVTPGMVELGKQEDKENRAFGEIMAGVADMVYLIGPKHTKPIYDGLLSGGMDAEKILVFRSLDEAAKALWAQVKTGDVILFENDLPDNYNE